MEPRLLHAAAGEHVGSRQRRISRTVLTPLQRHTDPNRGAVTAAAWKTAGESIWLFDSRDREKRALGQVRYSA